MVSCLHSAASLFIELAHRSIWQNSVFDNVPFMNEYYDNSMEKESKEMDLIKAAVREAGVFVVLGYSEKDRGTLYIAQVGFTNDQLGRPS